MNIDTVEVIVRPRTRSDLPPHEEGDAYLGGGTWLFSEPQPHLRRLVDLASLGWSPLAISEQGVEIAATCTLAQLHAAVLPAHWPARMLLPACCRALWGSFKVWNMATVGGNLCNALPAGPMISLTAALDGTCRIWGPEGAERDISIFDFITGAGRTALQPGELLRSIHLPAAGLLRHTIFRRAALTELGRSAAFVLGSVPAQGTGFHLTLTASVPRPARLSFPDMPDAAELAARIDATVPADGWFDDVHGAPAWRRAMTLHLAEEIRQEMCETVGA